MNIAPNAQNVTIGTLGTGSVRLPGSPAATRVGDLGVTDF
ncbi:hypothetical protein NB231_05351, partial [Nitrococcus mobilis Nb-231]